MPSDTRKIYRSYLVRCWVSTQTAPRDGARGRFVVESISEQPQRWGFDTFDDLIAFLRATLLEDAPEQGTQSPPSDAG